MDEECVKLATAVRAASTLRGRADAAGSQERTLCQNSSQCQPRRGPLRIPIDDDKSPRNSL